MNIMNLTQPNFNHSLYSINHNDSNLTLNSTNILQHLGKQIHKTPDNIRKSMRLAKQKHNYKNLDSQKNRYLMTKTNKQEKISQLTKDFRINARKISNLASKIPQHISIETFIERQKQKNKTFINHVRDKLINQAQINLKYPNHNLERIKRQFSPLRRGSLIVEKKIPRKLLKITFLNIEKAPLLKLYEKANYLNQQEEQSKQLKNTWNSSMIQTNFNRTGGKQEFQRLYQTNGFQTRKRQSVSQSIGLSSSLLKSKKFVPPFQRYYYRDFIWKIAFSNNLQLECAKQYEKKFKVFIGKGNNSLLVKSLMKRRSSWWVFTQRYDQANFIWTQIKINDIFRKQQKHKVSQKHQKSLLPKNLKTQKKNPNHLLNKKILSDQKLQIMQDYMHKHIKTQQKLDGTMKQRNKIMKKYGLETIDLNNIKIHNHLPNNYIIGNKKALYYTMTTYYEMMGQNPFEYLPETYHIQNGLGDTQYTKFLSSFYPRQKKANKDQRQNSPERERVKNIWIVKPGQFTNRGNGINVCLTLDQIKKILKSKQRLQNGNQRTYIIQSYIQKPFLYQKRKFDIRHYMMITSVNGQIKGYWYQYGYIRTTSYEYSVKTNFSSIHLTNDAVQKDLPDYGKYQKGNKLTYEIFQNYLDNQYNGRYNFFEEIYPKMKKIATDSIRASALMIDPQRKNFNFQIFGMDFMIDHNFKPWLIEINNNPCLELSCPYLAEIIPAMVQNALKICVDSLIPPPASFEQKRPKFSDNVMESNKFELVYDSSIQQESLQKILKGQLIPDKVKGLQDQNDQIYQDDGKQLDD